MRRVVARGLALTCGLFAVAAPSVAQTVERGQGVADRARPDYDPIGHPVGSFLIYPSITSTLDGTDNYRASDTDRQSDVYLTLAPEVDVSSDWSRNKLDGRFYFSQGLHAKLPSENAAQYGASADGQIDISRETAVTAEASVNHFIESRATLGSFQGSADPVQYEAYHAAAGLAQQFNRLVINASLGYNITDFHDVRGFDGSIIDQTYRNYNQLIGSATAKYDVGGGLGLLLTAEADKRTYTFGPGKPGFDIATTLDRESTGYTIEGGVSFELSSLVFGSVQLGLINRNYRDGRLRDLSGPTYNIAILWNVTPLTSLRFTAARAIDDTSSTIAAGNTRDDVSVIVDHELFRYVILSANGSYEHFRPNGPGVGGTQVGFGGQAKYLVNRHFSGGLSVQYADRTSDSIFLRYHAVTGGLFIKFAY